MRYRSALPPVLKTGRLFASLLLGQAATAVIYKVVDANGNVTYTDQAPAGEVNSAQNTGTDASADRPVAEQIEIQPPNTFVDTTPRELWNPDTTASAGVTRYSVAITSPAYDEVIRDNAGNLTVSTQTTPALQPGHLLKLEMNGTLGDSRILGGAINLANISRGTHRLRLVVVDAAGKRLAESAEHVFHLQRYSALQRNQNSPSAGP